jgi:hypothetical protein
MAAFSEEVILYPRATPGVSHIGRGVFDNEHRSIDPDTQQAISVNQPILGVNLNEFPVEIKQLDQVEIRGIRFSIRDKREDGLGGATLFLNKVRASDRIPDTRAP